MDEKEYPIVDHLRALRKCLWRAALGVTAAMIASLSFANVILTWLRAPMQKILGPSSHFVVLAPHEYFFTEMKAALFAGIFLASPWIMYQFWLFAAPGLYRREKYLAATFIASTVTFFVLGAYFAYSVVFPPMFQFFIGTLPADVQGNYSIGMLFGFATNLLLAFGFVFETPVVVFLLAVMGVVDLKTLSSARRYVIVISFIVAAILTPTPDPLTQVFMAIPMILLYELGLFIAKVHLRATAKSPE